MSIQEALDVFSFPVDSLRERMHELFKGPGMLSSLGSFAAAVDWTVRQREKEKKKAQFDFFLVQQHQNHLV